MEPEAALHGGSGAPATWHLCWQAAVGREFFPVPSLRARIRDRVVDAHRSRGRVLIDYCLLPTELHIVVQLEDGDEPGDLARAIGNVVARWVREARPIRSPVLAGPFRSHRIDSEIELRQEFHMLAWRPVVLGLCRGPTFYRDGAARVALGRSPVDGFDPRPMLGMFGTTVNGARAGLREWISRRPSDADWRAWELARGLTLAPSGVGPQPAAAREVKTAAAAALVAAAGDGGIDGALRLLTDWTTAKLGGPSIVDLHGGADAVAARGRALVARLAAEYALCSSASVARHFGRAKATLSEQMRASRSREADREIVATPVHRILDEVSALYPTGGPAARRRVDQRARGRRGTERS
jgi:hypothetical protein